MNTILFVYNNPLDGSYGGSQGTIKAFDGLKRNFNVISYSCIKKSNKFLTLLRNIYGYSGNLSRKDCIRIISILKKNKINYVFFDVSLHGRLVKKIKKRFPGKKIIVNYHNCEAQYFGDLYKTNGFIYFPIYRSAVKNEILSKKYADFHILITNEDRTQLGIFNNYSIIPVTIKDYFIEQKIKKEDKPYLLFVGAAQYANIEGAKYIIDKIAPHINTKVLIVGKGMKNIFSGNYENVEIFDYVNDLSQLYNGASAFISPLFYGSGAKVKVAEALMFGKKIIGTPLSFFGYNISEINCEICKSENEFISVINTLDMSKTFYDENRELFLKKYDSLNNEKYYSIIKTL